MSTPAIYLLIIFVLFVVNIANNLLEGAKKGEIKYVAYKDDYQKELEQQRKDKETQKETTREQRIKQQQKDASDRCVYNEMCRVVKNKMNDLPERMRREADYFFTHNSERVLAYMVKNNMYNPRFDTPIEVLLYGTTKLMADEHKARQQTANKYFQDQQQRQKRKEEEQQKQRQQARPTAIKGKADYCAVLGLGLNHSETELKKAYRTQAKLYHPDLQFSKTIKEKANAELMSRTVNEAHDYLIGYFAKKV